MSLGSLHLPLLTNLAYSVEDEGDHDGGGVCAALVGDTEDEMRVSLIRQYLVAVEILAESIRNAENDWSLGRPLVFLVHHVVEISLKTATEGRGADVPRTHDLSKLMATALAAGVFAGQSDTEIAWCSELAKLVGSITGDGTPGRFFDGVVDGGPIDDRWCCLNVVLIAESIRCFATLCIGDVERSN